MPTSINQNPNSVRSPKLLDYGERCINVTSVHYQLYPELTAIFSYWERQCRIVELRYRNGKKPPTLLWKFHLLRIGSHGQNKTVTVKTKHDKISRNATPRTKKTQTWLWCWSKKKQENVIHIQTWFLAKQKYETHVVITCLDLFLPVRTDPSRRIDTTTYRHYYGNKSAAFFTDIRLQSTLPKYVFSWTDCTRGEPQAGTHPKHLPFLK